MSLLSLGLFGRKKKRKKRDALPEPDPCWFEDVQCRMEDDSIIDAQRRCCMTDDGRICDDPCNASEWI